MHLLVSNSMVMAVSSARLMVWRLGCDLTSMCVTILATELTIVAPSLGLHVICDPFMYMKSFGCHAAYYGRFWVEYFVIGFMGMEGYVLLYACLRSRWRGFLRLRLKDTGWVSLPRMPVKA